MLHCTFVRSDVARGRIVSISTDAARGAGRRRGAHRRRPQRPSRDRWGRHRRSAAARPGRSALADDDVRFVGEPIVLIVAESRYVAEDARARRGRDRRCWLRSIDFRTALDGPDRASRARATCRRDAGAARTPSSRRSSMARRIRSRPFGQHRYLRCRWRHAASSRRRTRNVASSTSGCARRSRTRPSTVTGRITGVPRISSACEHDVGGGFGRSSSRPRGTDRLARGHHLGRTLKWIEDRRENLIASNHARADVARLHVRARRRRHLLGVRTSITSRMRVVPGRAAPPGLGALLFTGPYKIREASFRTRSVSPTPAGRGAVPRAVDVRDGPREQMVDRLRAPSASTRSNCAAPQRHPARPSFPHHAADWACRSTMVSPAETLEQAAEIIGYDEFRAEQQAQFQAGRLLGIGLGLYVEPSTAMGPDGAEPALIRVNPSGRSTCPSAPGRTARASRRRWRRSSPRSSASTSTTSRSCRATRANRRTRGTGGSRSG